MSQLIQFPEGGRSLRIVFMGTPRFALASLKALVENGYRVVGVVTGPDKPAGRGLKPIFSPVKEYALARGLTLLQPILLKDPRFLEKLRALGADIQVVVAFRILPEVVWNMPPLGTVNLHASLLPDYRGAAPVQWAVINGETQTGVTTFLLQQDVDSGRILLRESSLIGPDESSGSVLERLMELGSALLLRTLDGLAAGNLDGEPQPSQPLPGTCWHPAPKIGRQTGCIDWTWTCLRIRNLIRGLDPVPGAWCLLHQKNLKIFRANCGGSHFGTAPGSWDCDGKTYLRVACADCWLELLEVQQEGKKKMEIAEFLRGFRWKAL